MCMGYVVGVFEHNWGYCMAKIIKSTEKSLFFCFKGKAPGRPFLILQWCDGHGKYSNRQCLLDRPYTIIKS